MGVDNGARYPPIQLCIGIGGIDLAQHNLAVRPRQIEDAISQTPVMVLLDQAQGRIAGFADAEH